MCIYRTYILMCSRTNVTEHLTTCSFSEFLALPLTSIKSSRTSLKKPGSEASVIVFVFITLHSGHFECLFMIPLLSTHLELPQCVSFIVRIRGYIAKYERVEQFYRGNEFWFTREILKFSINLTIAGVSIDCSCRSQIRNFA